MYKPSLMTSDEKSTAQGMQRHHPRTQPRNVAAPNEVQQNEDRDDRKESAEDRDRDPCALRREPPLRKERNRARIERVIWMGEHGGPLAGRRRIGERQEDRPVVEEYDRLRPGMRTGRSPR